MRRAKHITPTRYGYRAHIRIEGTPYFKHFPTGTPEVDILQWVIDTELEHRTGPVVRGTFTEDARQYLRAVSAMTSYSDRLRHINAWIAVFGDRQRKLITSAEISAQLQTWRHTKSASTCNHLRTALQHLWTTLDGKAGRNPVRDVPKFREPDPEPRGLTFAQLDTVFKQMANSKTKARAMVMAHTGLPHSTLMRLTRNHIDYTAKTAVIPRRRKGAGTMVRVLPLTPQAIKAFKMLDRYDGWGKFSRSSLLKSLHRACVSAEVTPIRAYDLRHSFGTEAYARTGDIGAVQALLDHSSIKMTNRYTLRAVDERVRRAVAALAKRHQ